MKADCHAPALATSASLLSFQHQRSALSQAVLFCSTTVSGWPILYVSDEWCKGCGMLASSVLTQPLWTLFEPQTCSEVGISCRSRMHGDADAA